MAVALVLPQVVAALVIFSVMGIHNPTSTAFMRANPDGAIYQWVDADNISRNLLVALVAHEDSQLPDRTGPFTFTEFKNRAGAYLHGRSDPSGSTIDQQLAKNMWLSPSRSMFRKAAEADMAALGSVVLDARRRLELYANVAQMGPGIYGACAASWYYFGIDPAKLTVDQAGQLNGLLPNPDAYPRAKNGGVQYRAPKPGRPGDTVAYARAHVLDWIRGVGGLTVTERMGIPGLAQTHVGGVKCNVMPAAVRARLAKEHALPPAAAPRKAAAHRKAPPPKPVEGLPIVDAASRARWAGVDKGTLAAMATMNSPYAYVVHGAAGDFIVRMDGTGLPILVPAAKRP